MSGQRTLSLGFRDFHPNNYERLVAIYNGNYPDYPMSVAERRSRDQSVDRTKYLLRRFECVDMEENRRLSALVILSVCLTCFILESSW